MGNKEKHKRHVKESERQIVQNVDQYGFHIALVEGNEYLPAFVYTIGFYKTYNHPEIIVFGLKNEVMQHLLYHIGEEVKQGETFLTGVDYNGFLADYPIRFVKVDIAHYPDYLGFAGWFYDKSFDFPTYQLIWTDKESRYPWDGNFYDKWKFKQPVLDRNTDFKFYEERNLGVYTTQATLEGKPIISVYHNEDGDWQFHSEENPKLENAKIVCLEYLVKKDPSLNEIHHLNYGQYALRESINSKWEIYEEE